MERSNTEPYLKFKRYHVETPSLFGLFDGVIILHYLTELIFGAISIFNSAINLCVIFLSLKYFLITKFYKIEFEDFMSHLLHVQNIVVDKAILLVRSIFVLITEHNQTYKYLAKNFNLKKNEQTNILDLKDHSFIEFVLF